MVAVREWAGERGKEGLDERHVLIGDLLGDTPLNSTHSPFAATTSSGGVSATSSAMETVRFPGLVEVDCSFADDIPMETGGWRGDGR